MARAHCVYLCQGIGGENYTRVLQGATVYVYQTGTTTAITEPLYSGPSGGTTLSNPLTSGSVSGAIEFWLDAPKRVDLAISKTGYTSQTVTVDVTASDQAQVPLILTNPTTTTGFGTLLKNSAQYSVSATGQMALAYLSFRNTSTTPPDSGGYTIYGLYIDNVSDAVDGAAGIGLNNTGQGDALYINAAGKSTGDTVDTTPTGIGIDVNRSDYTKYAGFGIQIYDWSATTSAPDAGVMRQLFLKKHVNLNTDNICLDIYSNRKALRLLVNSGDAGYSASQALLYLADENGGGNKWQVNADGSQSLIGNLTLTTGRLVLGTSGTPASAAATGTTGTVVWDASYLYVCTATNTWRRVAHATW